MTGQGYIKIKAEAFEGRAEDGGFAGHQTAPPSAIMHFNNYNTISILPVQQLVVVQPADVLRDIIYSHYYVIFSYGSSY